MGGAKGEGRSRGARSKSDRRASGSDQAGRNKVTVTVERPAQSMPPGLGQTVVVEAELEQAVRSDSRAPRHSQSLPSQRPSVDDAVSRAYETLAREPSRERSVPPEPMVIRPPGTLRQASSLYDAPSMHVDSANSNHRADMVRYVPPALALPSGDESKDQRPSREHAARLEAASVLDAPASLTESVSPPAQATSWAMRIWVATMLGIIGAAGVVAIRQPNPPEVEATAAADSAETADAVPSEAAPSGAASALVPVGPAPEEVPRSIGSELLAEDTPEARAKARRAARRAALAEQAALEAAAQTSSPADKVPSSTARAAQAQTAPVPAPATGPSTPERVPAARTVDNAAPSLAPALRNAAVREPARTPHVTPSIPGNPYDEAVP